MTERPTVQRSKQDTLASAWDGNCTARWSALVPSRTQGVVSSVAVAVAFRDLCWKHCPMVDDRACHAGLALPLRRRFKYEVEYATSSSWSSGFGFPPLLPSQSLAARAMVGRGGVPGRVLVWSYLRHALVVHTYQRQVAVTPGRDGTV
nr:hypothetical protein CFP56_53648 [Quercus suber]